MIVNEENDTQKSINIIAIIILSILIVFVIGNYFITNSDKYITRKYYEFNNYKFEGEIYDKRQDQPGTGANINRYIDLKSGISHNVNYQIYNNIELGDYVVKKAKSDTVYYIKNGKDTIKSMENHYLTEFLKINSKK